MYLNPTLEHINEQKEYIKQIKKLPFANFQAARKIDFFIVMSSVMQHIR